MFGVSWDAPIVVASTDPAELQRASQAMADAMADAIRRAPEQWYSFKPVWPASAAESADLERRGRAMQAGQPDPGPARDLPRDEADQVGRKVAADMWRRCSLRGRLLLAPAGLPAPERSAFRSPDWWGRGTGGLGRAAQAAGTCAACGRAGVLPRQRDCSRAADPQILERLVRSSFRHAARYYLEVARNPSVTREYVDERLALDTPELIADAVVPGKAVLFVGLHFGSVELASLFLACVGETVSRWRRSTTPDCRPTSSGPVGWPGSALSASARRAGRCSTHSATASRSAWSETAT
jgi:hypothetical protein